MSSKYRRYKIIVNYLNGNKEEIEYINNRPVNTSSYKDMMKVYKEVKEQYINICSSIDFIGITEDEQLNIMYSKKNKQDNDNSENSFELIEQLNEIVNKLKKKSTEAQDLLSLIDKEKNVFEHKYIEFAELDDLVDEYKIEKFDEYRNLLLRRRIIKDEATNLKNVKEQIDIIFENTDRLYKRTQGYINKAILSTESAIAQTVPSDLDKQIVKEYKYKNHGERINLMSQIEHKFDKVVVIEEENKIKCYNKSKKAS
jgi:hypothetical protein